MIQESPMLSSSNLKYPPSGKPRKANRHEVKESPKISELLPNTFSVSNLIVTGTDPLIFSARVLLLEEAQMLPIIEDLKPKIDPETKVRKYATIGGYSFLESIFRAQPSDYHKILWSRCADMPTWIGSVRFSNTLEELLKVFENTKFGDVVVEDQNNEKQALVSLEEVVSLYRVARISSDLRAVDVGSKKISISSDSTISECLRLMFEKHVRRLFIPNGRDAKLEFVSARDLIRFLLSPERLELVKSEPEQWLNEIMENVPGGEARSVADDVTINQASKLIGERIDDCLVCRESDKVVSRWDLVMKPWTRGKMVT